MLTIHVRHGAHQDAVQVVNHLPADLDPAQEQLVWLDIEAPTPEEIGALGRTFGFHPLAVEDAFKQHQRPKLDSYGGYDFITFYAVGAVQAAPGLVRRELGMFVGRNYLVTIHTHPVPELLTARERWHTQEAILGEKGVGFLLYCILDTLVDGYFPAVEALGDELDELETELFERGGRGVLQRATSIRRRLLEMRRLVSPERDILGILVRTDQPFFDAALLLYFTDVYDHLIRVNDAVDLQRDLIASLMEGYLSVVSNDLNQIMKVLAAYATILMVLSLVAGIFGMNFTSIPGLEAPWGFTASVASMVVIAAGVAYLFRRNRWL